MKQKFIFFVVRKDSSTGKDIHVQKVTNSSTGGEKTSSGEFCERFCCPISPISQLYCIRQICWTFRKQLWLHIHFREWLLLQHCAVINWLLLIFYNLKVQNHMPPVMAQTKKMSNKLFFAIQKVVFVFGAIFRFLFFFFFWSYSLSILWPFWVGSKLRTFWSKNTHISFFIPIWSMEKKDERVFYN